MILLKFFFTISIYLFNFSLKLHSMWTNCLSKSIKDSTSKLQLEVTKEKCFKECLIYNALIHNAWKTLLWLKIVFYSYLKKTWSGSFLLSCWTKYSTPSTKKSGKENLSEYFIYLSECSTILESHLIPSTKTCWDLEKIYIKIFNSIHQFLFAVCHPDI